MNVLCIIPARMTSQRFPGKCLADLNGKPVLQHVIERCCQSLMTDEVVVAIPSNPANAPLKDWLAGKKAKFYAPDGVDEDDVLGRFVAVVKHYQPDIVVRVNGDSPLILPDLIDRAVKELQARRSSSYKKRRKGYDCDYVGYCFGSMPSALTRYGAPEVFTANTLLHWASIREHVTPAAYSSGFSHWVELAGTPIATVVDTPDDLQRVKIQQDKEKWN